jgi:predicted PurR-regulated permease PerM
VPPPDLPVTQPRQDLTRITLGVAAIGALTLASFWIVRPFIAPTIWATMIVVATWPVLVGVQARLGGRRWLAVLVMTGAMLLVFVVPFMLAIGTLIENADRISGWITTLLTATPPPAPAWLAKVPLAGPRLATLWNEVVDAGASGLMPRLQPYAGGVAQWFLKEAGTVGGALLQFLLTVIITAIMYAHGDGAAAGVRAFGRRLAGVRGEDVVTLGGQAIRGVALGVVVTALAQSILGGIGLAITGVPFAPVLTALMFILCIAQIGPILVLAPAVAWMFWTGDTVWASVLAVWTIVVGTMDNVLRPFLIKKGADLPLLLIFAGVIGGLLGFGLLGIFVGPLVLAVTYTLLEAWVRDAPAPAAGAAPARAGGRAE